jgi:hypothetical protein
MQTVTMTVVSEATEIETEWRDEDDEVVTLASMAQKMEWEGGFDAMLSYGGAKMFPPALRPLLSVLTETIKHLETAITAVTYAADDE